MSDEPTGREVSGTPTEPGQDVPEPAAAGRTEPVVPDGHEAAADTEADAEADADTDAVPGAGVDREADTGVDAETVELVVIEAAVRADPDAEADIEPEADGSADPDGPDRAHGLDGEPDGRAILSAPAPAPRRRGLTGGLRASVLIGVLFALLGFGLAVQVHTNSSTSGLASARQDDLVRILDDLSSREDRLRQQIASLQEARRELSTSGDKASVALSEARTRSTTLAILAGTEPARGPGVQVVINDPGRRLDAEDLLDAVEELRAAGAEAFQIGSVRIGMSSSFTDDGGSILADGTPLDPPYVIIAIGDPGTLATALNIPGGVVASVRNAGGQAVVTQRDRLVISALRPLQAPHYASPAPKRGN